MERKILPHIITKLKEQSRNLDTDVVTSSLDGIVEVMSRGCSSYCQPTGNDMLMQSMASFWITM